MPAPIAVKSPPTKPDQVLFGENRGQSLGPFRMLPTAKAPMSAPQVQANSISVHQTPWLVARTKSGNPLWATSMEPAASCCAVPAPTVTMSRVRP